MDLGEMGLSFSGPSPHDKAVIFFASLKNFTG
jgi:hypothetical protein